VHNDNRVDIEARGRGNGNDVDLPCRPLPTGGSSKAATSAGDPGVERGRMSSMSKPVEGMHNRSELVARMIYPVPSLRFILRFVRKRLKRRRSVIACHSRRIDWPHVGVQSSCAYSEGL